LVSISISSTRNWGIIILPLSILKEDDHAPVSQEDRKFANGAQQLEPADALDASVDVSRARNCNVIRLAESVRTRVDDSA